MLTWLVDMSETGCGRFKLTDAGLVRITKREMKQIYKNNHEYMRSTPGYSLYEEAANAN